MTSNTLSPATATPAPAPSRRVVDATTRMLHWLMAFTFTTAYLTADGERWRLVHVTLGYTLAALVVARLLWGLVGPRPVRLSVVMALGVCDEICLPATLELTSDLASPGAPDASIKAALQARAETAGEAGVTGVTCQVDPITDGLRVTARVRLPDPGHPEVVAFETANREVWVSEAVTERRGGELISMTELVPPNGAPFALDRSGITMTILAANGAVEVKGCPAP